MLRVIQAGFHNTIQDSGRHASQHLGVSHCGALDLPAMQLANMLLHNTDAAVLEITFGPVELLATKDCWLSITGADFNAHIQGHGLEQRIWPASRFLLKQGQHFILNGAKTGMRCYLAVEGGFKVNSVLHSGSTDTTNGFGGCDGRPILADDHLERNEIPNSRLNKIKTTTTVSQPLNLLPIRVIKGPEFDQLTIDSQHLFEKSLWQLQANSNRMGARVKSQRVLQMAQNLSMRSHAVHPGLIQLPPNGQPIILLADAQATGGYPRIANVIDADLWKLAQLRPGQQFSFQVVDIDEAERALDGWHRYFFQIRHQLSLLDSQNMNTKTMQHRYSPLQLNADIGEGGDCDAELFEIIDCANIACGGHVGNDSSMAATIKLAKRHQVIIGAHPSYPDPKNFGRAAMDIEDEALYGTLLSQVLALAAQCRLQSQTIRYIKPHGALYNIAAKEPKTAQILFRLVKELQTLSRNGHDGLAPNLQLMVLANSPIVQWAEDAGVETISEAFADRRYLSNGTLAPRTSNGAVINDLQTVLQQVRHIQTTTPISTLDYGTLKVDATSLCVHGDNQHALDFAKAIRDLLKA
ncbi:5-oxoprolinase subunit PxpA [Shewanella gelidii]|uniref:Carboxyltransferase domain-containing protein n=1 Tax=Shewanella gelidii TaxID=1642821 RepID=A0A917JXL9_9GAMM|nr:5-oxoprolinase subunit PxpA [Shewanella gelidii]MCL1099417.1 5-oxoprolinase subunit PxpA [Shewanella gelidii]GGI91583.1 hypothetical protein GCM10009332_31190 [Shewanella gelidii]